MWQRRFARRLRNWLSPESNGPGWKQSPGCDIIGLPTSLYALLGTGPAIAEDMPIVGLWPVSARTALLDWLADPQNRSVYRFADHINARRVALDASLRNINRPEDLP